mgnify:CR=1 FL=1
MQKIILYLSLIAPLFCLSQRNKTDMDHEAFFRFGAKGGVNVNKITGKSYKEGFNYNYQVGAFVQINFSNRIGLQPEVNFVQTSA